LAASNSTAGRSCLPPAPMIAFNRLARSG